MCGIAGIMVKSGAPSQRALAAAARLLDHRGPDNVAIAISGPVGLVHTRLSIIDVEGGDQPLLSADQNCRLVANGEIYNYIELKDTHITRGQVYRSDSDCESILHEYMHSGAESVAALNGMFAFALHDQSKQRLILARDRLGIKPLFYAVEPDRIAFASEIKALLPLLSEKPRLRPQAIIEYLQNQFNTGHETIFENVYRVAPAQLMIISDDLSINRKIYWDLTHVTTNKLSQAQAEEEFDPLFNKVFSEHVRSDVPFGLFLSGGVDSAIAVAMLARLNLAEVKSYCVGFGEALKTGEVEGAQRISQLYSTHHETIELDRQQTFFHLPRMVWSADDLMRDYASLPTSVLSQRAAKDLKVVFTGEGGDEAFAGYGRYKKHWLDRALRNMVYPGSGGFRVRGQLRRGSYHSILGDELAQYSDDYRRPFVEAWQRCPKNWSAIQKSQFCDISTALPDNLLVKVDRATMSYGLEARVPFLDHRVVEFGLSLPDNLKVSGRGNKLFLKNWAINKLGLPRDHMERKKTGFNVPVDNWLDTNFLNQLQGKLAGNGAIKQWFRPDGVTKLFNAHRAGRNYSRAIWSLMQFAIWHRLFAEGHDTIPTSSEDPLDWIS